jgi:hypothetical protein
VASDRDLMDEAIRSTILPKLRSMGFKGSLPHFRRVRETYIDLLSFQHFSAGGSLVVEIARAPVGGFVTSWGKAIPANKLNVTYIAERLRLGCDPHVGGDHWFVYGPRSYDPPQPRKRVVAQAQAAAAEVVALLDMQAEPWWTRA